MASMKAVASGDPDDAAIAHYEAEFSLHPTASDALSTNHEFMATLKRLAMNLGFGGAA